MADPIQEEYRAKMQALAKMIDEMLNGDKQGDDRDTGFAILMFDFKGPNDRARMNYLSNSSREDMISAFKEAIAHLEGRHIAGEHETKQ